MSTTGYFVLVESGRGAFGRAPLHAARAAGLEPVLVARDPALYTPDAAEAREWAAATAVVVRADTTDPGDVVRQLAAAVPLEKVVGVAAVIDYFVDTAARVARELGLPGCAPEAAATARNKHLTRLACAAAGVLQPRFRWVGGPEDLDGIGADVGFPCVAKPLAEAASIGVRWCADEAELRDHVGRLAAAPTNVRGNARPAGVLVEQFVTGIEVSVETITLPGGRHVVGVIDKVLGEAPAFVELGECFPSALPSTCQDEAVATACAALDAIGLDLGPAHVEVILTDAGAVLVEINARAGGALVGRLVREAHGVDLTAAMVSLCSGGSPDLRPRADRAAASRYLVAPTSGRLTTDPDLSGLGAVSGLVHHRMYVGAGGVVRRPSSNADTVGEVLVVQDAPAAAAAWATVAARTIHLEVAADASIADLFFADPA